MQEYKNMFVLETEPSDFKEKMKGLRDKLKCCVNEEKLKELAEISIDSQSYLTKWNLQNNQLPIEQRVSTKDLAEEVLKNFSLLRKLGQHDVVDKIETEMSSINSSVMQILSLKTDIGFANNQWSNNDGAGLKHAMRRGAIAVTTNPQIINMTRKGFPEYWDKKKEEIKNAHKSLSLEHIAAKVTTEMVLESARLLRPVYEFGDANLGYVSLQVNPQLSSDSEAMIKDALMIYDWLKEDFDGKEPNVVFKIPGTFSGLDVAKELTSKGIGVNITVNYTVAQQLAFGEIIEAGRARHCYLTQMNLRLEDPIAVELGEEKCDSADKISSWSSAAVTRKAYKILYRERMYENSILLGASISKPWHVERAIIDGNGCPMHMTISPNAVENFNTEIGRLSPCISEEIDRGIMWKLLQSETFRKAYELDGLKPADFDTYKPTLKTLNGFKEHYDEFLQWCKK